MRTYSGRYVPTLHAETFLASARVRRVMTHGWRERAQATKTRRSPTPNFPSPSSPACLSQRFLSRLMFALHGLLPTSFSPAILDHAMSVEAAPYGASKLHCRLSGKTLPQKIQCGDHIVFCKAFNVYLSINLPILLWASYDSLNCV